MNSLICLESYITEEKNHFGSFLIEPLEIGQGITLGNALRRTLLSDLTGYSITGVRLNNIKHEFATIDGLREDVLEVLLNLKEIVLKSSFEFNKNYSAKSKIKGFLNVKGPIVVTAGMLQLPKGLIKIINPNQYICTIVNDKEIYLEIDIEKGKGYRLAEENQKKNKKEELLINKSSTLSIDAMFMPIKKVNYKIKLIHDTNGNIKESLNLEILTNGSITPKRSIQESLKILMNLFYSLFIDEEFLNISSELSKNLYK
jgi:DNA-directed RNA polymerase subunit alpha